MLVNSRNLLIYIQKRFQVFSVMLNAECRIHRPCLIFLHHLMHCHAKMVFFWFLFTSVIQHNIKCIIARSYCDITHWCTMNTALYIMHVKGVDIGDCLSLYWLSLLARQNINNVEELLTHVRTMYHAITNTLTFILQAQFF